MCWAGVGGATTAAGGADAYGYISQADLWIAGDLRPRQPWMTELPWPNARATASPLGYRPSDLTGEEDALVPVYSPGLPLMMAGAKALFGHEALFWVTPITGAVLVLATFGIGSRLGSPGLGLAAAWLLATSPVVLFMLMQPMSDVPAAAAWAAAAWFALGSGWRASLAAGLLSGLAILIRPNLFLLAGAIALWLVFTPAPWAAGARRLAIFAAGVTVPIAWLAWHFTQLYGSPAVSGYGSLEGAFRFAHLWPNFVQYTRWLIESQTILAVAGVAALFLPLRRLWPFVRDSRVLQPAALIVALLAVQYFLYFVYDTWWFLRFFLPAWPFFCLGLAAVCLAGIRHHRPAIALLSVWLVVALGIYTLRSASKYGVFGLWIGDRTYPELSRLVAEEIPENSAVFTLIFSGALRYYGGRVTLRYDHFDPEWLDRAVAWLESRGVRAYALLPPWEVPQFQERFRGQRAAANLEQSVRLIYRGVNTIALYDLSGAVETLPRRVDAADPALFRSVPPVPAPTLHFAR